MIFQPTVRASVGRSKLGALRRRRRVDGAIEFQKRVRLTFGGLFACKTRPLERKEYS